METESIFQLELWRGMEACLACLYAESWVACKYQQKQNLNLSPCPSCSANSEQNVFCVGKSRAWEMSELARTLKHNIPLVQTEPS